MIPARGGGKLDGLFILLFASQIFMILSFVRLYGDAGSAAFGTGVIDAVLSQPIWGTKLGAELAQFVMTLVLLHATLAVLCWVLARITRAGWPESRSSQRSFAILWFLGSVVWLLAANAMWYPLSSLGEPYADVVASGIAGVTVFAMLTAGLASAILVVFAVALFRNRSLARSKVVWIGGLAFLACGIALPVFNAFGHAGGTPRSDRPHVVVIGLDSLRADYVQGNEPGLTPGIDGFLSGSARFSNAYTPLARTFPAWVSIVSGRHPHTTGAFVNLLPRDLIHEGATMPAILAASGYSAVYAIDEVRFSNLDESYGFDEMLAPPMGAADFLLGFFADTPLSNVIVNTPVGGWLFPYGHANRGAATIYDPDAFVERIADAVSFDEPTLLAVHFTLVHWPYTWATAPLTTKQEMSGLSFTERAHVNYRMAVRRVDEQFRDLMEVLEEKGALENAIVVVLSDHGESLGEPSPIAAHDHVIDNLLRPGEIFGHGTHVFSPDQYHVVLGMRSYGNELLPGNDEFDLPVSLEDVAPTMLDLLDLDGDQDFDGRSLLPYVQGDDGSSLAGRIRFLETEFNPAGISPEVVATASAISTAIDKYEVDPATDRVLVRKEFIGEMLDTRQYAAESGGRIFASIPASDYRQQHLLYYDPATGTPRWFGSPPTAADGAEVTVLWEALEQRFAPVRDRPIVPPPVREEPVVLTAP
jgi:arylsulfatase A-like enzyme